MEEFFLGKTKDNSYVLELVGVPFCGRVTFLSLYSRLLRVWKKLERFEFRSNLQRLGCDLCFLILIKERRKY